MGGNRPVYIQYCKTNEGNGEQVGREGQVIGMVGKELL